MAVKTPSYLWRSPRGIYYFRLRLPAELVRSSSSSKRPEFRRSLGTGNRQQALVRARRIWLSVHDHIRSIENRMEGEENDIDLIDEVLRHLKAEDDSQKTKSPTRKNRRSAVPPVNIIVPFFW